MYENVVTQLCGSVAKVVQNIGELIAGLRVVCKLEADEVSEMVADLIMVMG